MAGSGLLMKILADFLLGFYLLNIVLNHATNNIHKRKQVWENRKQQ
jgi:hypothetical protein